MYQIKALARKTNISTRTLRYYDQIGLLKAHRHPNSDYRYYNDAHLDRLQQILIYKEMNVPLSQIKAILDEPTCDLNQALHHHLEMLLKQQEELSKKIQHIERQLGGTTMTVEQRFEHFKQTEYRKNKAQYESELNEKYDAPTLEAFDQHYLNLDYTTFKNAEEAERQLCTALKDLLENPVSLNHEKAHFIFNAHQSWLKAMAPYYSKNYHLQMADLYVHDERFAQYYTHLAGEGAPELLAKIIYHYA